MSAPRDEPAERRSWIRREAGRPCPSPRGESRQMTGHIYKSAKYVPGTFCHVWRSHPGDNAPPGCPRIGDLFSAG